MLRRIVLFGTVSITAFLHAQQPPQASPPTSAAPQSDTAALQQAHQMLERGEVEKAIAALKAIHERNENVEGLNREMGVAYFRQSDYVRSTYYLEKFTASHPSDKEAVQLLGLSYFFIAKPASAIPLLERVQDWYPNAHVDASYVLGVCYIRTKDYEKARRAFATMYRVPPDSAVSHLFLARMLTRQGDDAIAEQEAKQATTIDPKLPGAHYLLGEMYIFKSRIPEAINEFEAELKVNPTYAATYYRLADAYTHVLRWEEAERLLQQSIWLDATASGPYILMGKVLLKKNDATLAVRSLQRALSMDPNNYIGHNLLGQAYRMQGKTQQADSELQLSQKLQEAQSSGAPELK